MAKTAAAETSLAVFASLDILGLVRSTRASIAVFISSKVITALMVKIKVVHSWEEIFRTKPAVIAKTAKTR